jgi:threonine/homoserine/homoserine lactone efflux protein
MSLQFLLTSFIIIASPGTGVVYTVATALSRGPGPSVVAALGCTLGIVPHLLAALFGLAAVLHTSALVFDIFRYGGVVYLLYMAWMSLRETGTVPVDARMAPASAFSIIGRAVVLNLLNPKLSIFFLAFLPQFVTADDPAPLAHMLVLSASFMALTFIVFAIYGLFAALMREKVMTRPKVMLWLRRSFAGAFVLLGLKLVVAERA